MPTDSRPSKRSRSRTSRTWIWPAGRSLRRRSNGSATSPGTWSRPFGSALLRRVVESDLGTAESTEGQARASLAKRASLDPSDLALELALCAFGIDLGFGISLGWFRLGLLDPALVDLDRVDPVDATDRLADEAASLSDVLANDTMIADAGATDRRLRLLASLRRFRPGLAAALAFDPGDPFGAAMRTIAETDAGLARAIGPVLPLAAKATTVTPDRGQRASISALVGDETAAGELRGAAKRLVHQLQTAPLTPRGPGFVTVRPSNQRLGRAVTWLIPSLFPEQAADMLGEPRHTVGHVREARQPGARRRDRQYLCGLAGRDREQPGGRGRVAGPDARARPQQARPKAGREGARGCRGAGWDGRGRAGGAVTADLRRRPGWTARPRLRFVERRDRGRDRRSGADLMDRRERRGCGPSLRGACATAPRATWPTWWRSPTTSARPWETSGGASSSSWPRSAAGPSPSGGRGITNTRSAGSRVGASSGASRDRRSRPKRWRPATVGWPTVRAEPCRCRRTTRRSSCGIRSRRRTIRSTSGAHLVVTRRITQPFKQAFRETYRIDLRSGGDGVLDRRFADRPLAYAQMRALMGARGWSAPMLGPFDQGDRSVGFRDFVRAGLRAELDHVPAGLGDPRDRVDYARSGAVRFTTGVDDRRSPMLLADVPPRVLSEALRDVDLFTSVPDLLRRPSSSTDDEASQLVAVRGRRLAAARPDASAREASRHRRALAASGERGRGVGDLARDRRDGPADRRTGGRGRLAGPVARGRVSPHRR